LVAFAATMCIAAMGLLIGTLAQTDEQAVIFFDCADVFV
jgi:hypothetical protein